MLRYNDMRPWVKGLIWCVVFTFISILVGPFLFANTAGWFLISTGIFFSLAWMIDLIVICVCINTGWKHDWKLYKKQVSDNI